MFVANGTNRALAKEIEPKYPDSNEINDLDLKLGLLVQDYEFSKNTKLVYREQQREGVKSARDKRRD